MLLQSFLKGAKLRRWLGRLDCPPAIKECKVLFDKAYAPPRDGYVSPGDHGCPSGGDPTIADETHILLCAISISPDLQPIVKQSKVTLHARLASNGVIYTRSSTHVRNSPIYFYADGDKTSRPTPGCIKYIFELNGTTSFAVQRQLPMRDGSMDPFRHYPHFAASLYSAELSLKLEIVHVDWVMCHFARWPMSIKQVVVLLLSLLTVHMLTAI
jgi:hypothetical protein